MKRKILVFATVLLTSASHTWAAEEENLVDLKIENVQIVMELDYIQLSFLVRDANGNFINDLSAEDFALVENGAPKAITALKEQEVPISAAIMVDTSWSIGSYLENAVETGLNLFRGLENENSAFIFFSESPRMALDWSEKPADLSFLRDVQTDGKTALYDSVIWTAENLFAERPGKKLIILITDGIDTISQATFQEMIDATRRLGITLYPIIYTNAEIQNYRKRLRIRPQSMIRPVSQNFHNFVVLQNRFLDQSMRYGGRAIFSNQFTDLRKIYGDIVREMKSHYVMLYKSDTTLDGEARDVRVSTKRIPGKIFIEVSQ